MAVHDMTEGNITGHLARYSVPLILGNILQLTYNVVDSIIAGRFIGKEALAAEGIVSPLINLIILSISGICIGAGVLMSELFGAKKEGELRKEMATTVLSGFIISLAAVALGIVFSNPLLRLLQVPGEVFSMTGTYLRIIFLGIPFTYFYNALAAGLKSVGDSKTPLKFLAFSSILNALLDLIFIGGLGFGIVCSAVTTVAAEALSALLAVVYIYRSVPLLRPRAGEFVIVPEYLKKTFSYGAVTALQQSIQPLAKLLIQGAVNGLGVDMIAAYNAVTRIDDYAYTPQQSIAHGVTTFIAQNRGAGKNGRIKKGFKNGVMLELIYWAALCLLVLVSREYLVGMFVTGEGKETIVEIGSRYLGTMAFFYVFPAMTNVLQGFFRGVGRMKLTAVCTFIQAGLRTGFSYMLTPSMGIYGIAFAAMMGWVAMLLYEVPQYLIYLRRLAG